MSTTIPGKILRSDRHARSDRTNTIVFNPKSISRVFVRVGAAHLGNIPARPLISCFESTTIYIYIYIIRWEMRLSMKRNRATAGTGRRDTNETGSRQMPSNTGFGLFGRVHCPGMAAWTNDRRPTVTVMILTRLFQTNCLPVGLHVLLTRRAYPGFTKTQNYNHTSLRFDMKTEVIWIYLSRTIYLLVYGGPSFSWTDLIWHIFFEHWHARSRFYETFDHKRLNAFIF